VIVDCVHSGLVGIHGVSALLHVARGSSKGRELVNQEMDYVMEKTMRRKIAMLKLDRVQAGAHGGHGLPALLHVVMGVKLGSVLVKHNLDVLVYLPRAVQVQVKIFNIVV